MGHIMLQPMPLALLADSATEGATAGAVQGRWNQPPTGAPQVPAVGAHAAYSSTTGADPGLGLALWGPLSLALLLTLGVLLLVRRVRRGALDRQGGSLALLAQLPLSQQHTLYLVQAGGHTLLLGGAPGGLNLLQELPPGSGQAGMATGLAMAAGRFQGPLAHSAVTPAGERVAGLALDDDDDDDLRVDEDDEARPIAVGRAGGIADHTLAGARPLAAGQRPQ